MNLNKYKHIFFSLAISSLLLFGLSLLLMPNASPSTVHAWSATLMPSPTPPATRPPGPAFVKSGGTGGWCLQDDPCGSIRYAIDQCEPGNGDTIYVAGGSYTGTGGAVITVTKSITLYGGWDGTTTTPVVRDPDAYPTTLNGEDSRHVVYISGNITPTIDGFIITGGKAEEGGGIYIHNASPIIQNNVITANRTIDGGFYPDGRGGGIFVDGSGNAIITQNRIISNTSGYGGGIYHYNPMVAITITANEIAGNVVSHRAGGIMVERAPDVIKTNVISGNIANEDSGGMLIFAAAPRVEANRIVNNVASGGGISMINGAKPILMNNLLIGNTQDGLYVAGGSSPEVINNTIVGSGLTGSGNGINLWSRSNCTSDCTTGVYTNNIIVSYEVGIYGTGPITPAIDYNDVWGNTTADFTLPSGVVTGTHNISLDPLFANPAADDYHLQSDSPCVDAGDPAGVPPAPPTDLDGDSRPIGGRVDIGADEFYCDALTGVGITGPTAGDTSVSYVFTATVAPPTVTLPVTYTWQANGQNDVVQSGAFTQTTVPFTWSSPGTQVITVTAENCGGTVVTTQHTVVISTKVYLPLVLRNYQP